MEKTKRQSRRRPKIGVVLGGGGAKGLAHIGVLKVLEEAEIPIDGIVGTSVGAFIGGAYASGVPIPQMIEMARRIRWSDLGRLRPSRLGLRDGRRMEDFIRAHFPVTRFEELRIPLAVVATDIATGQMRVFTTGDLAFAIRASCAIPGYFTPALDEEGRMLVDGAIVANLPTLVAVTLGAERVIAVDVNAYPIMETPPRNAFQIYTQALAILSFTAQSYMAEHADVLISPDVASFSWDELERADELIRAGEEAARKRLPDCRALLSRREGFFRRLRQALLIARHRAVPLRR
ncbi:putative NTE family protein [bacterium HR10]|uniref:Patatin n=1 Tax=uncultured Acidobacteriota bacterium TaxID=171953 RepID=H5SIT6_9BACT|nr:patatin [uncultured Acidobacteriota bacterium]GBC82254.1 putative NTE family protein [bacterium HR10]